MTVSKRDSIIITSVHYSLRAAKLLILVLKTGMSCQQNYLTRMGWKVLIELIEMSIYGL